MGSRGTTTEHDDVYRSCFTEAAMQASITASVPSTLTACGAELEGEVGPEAHAGGRVEHRVHALARAAEHVAIEDASLVEAHGGLVREQWGARQIEHAHVLFAPREQRLHDVTAQHAVAADDEVALPRALRRDLAGTVSKRRTRSGFHERDFGTRNPPGGGRRFEVPRAAVIASINDATILLLIPARGQLASARR